MNNIHMFNLTYEMGVNVKNVGSSAYVCKMSSANNSRTRVFFTVQRQ